MRKIISIALLSIFLTQQCVWADDKLAPPSVFAKSTPAEKREEFERKAGTVLISIGKRKSERLEPSPRMSAAGASSRKAKYLKALYDSLKERPIPVEASLAGFRITKVLAEAPIDEETARREFEMLQALQLITVDGEKPQYRLARPIAHLTTPKVRALLSVLSSEDLEFDILNILPGQLAYARAKVAAIVAMLSNDWAYLFAELMEILKVRNPDLSRLADFLKTCNQTSLAQATYPVQSRYPILHAASLLPKEEKEKLKLILSVVMRDALPKNAVVDAIFLMLLDKKDIPHDWVKRSAPNLENRRVWQVSSEIWNPGGGLGRVTEFHGIGMSELLKGQGVGLSHIEPYYELGLSRQTSSFERLDYSSILGINEETPAEDRLKEVERFNVSVGDDNALAVCYRAVNSFGIETYLIKGFRGDQKVDADELPYYTGAMYHYWPLAPHMPLAPIEEFSTFFPRASLELIRRIEAKGKAARPEGWKAPVMHFNDGQLALAQLFKDMDYSKDEILGDALLAFTTHTYRNRLVFWMGTGMAILRRLGLERYWPYFQHYIGDELSEPYHQVIDFTSCGIRLADWRGGVSDEHVDNVAMYDKWGGWEDIELVAVTNGDAREITAAGFRDIMKEVCGPDVDVEEPSPEQVLKTKRRAKELFGLDPNLPVLSYTGRCVDEKAGRNRALTDANIKALVKLGVQVVIGANVLSNPAVVRDLAILSDTIKQKKAANPQEYRGNFILLCNIGIEEQREIFAVTDIHVQDSDPRTGAAENSEADTPACAGLVLAPPWKEGNLQDQGIPLNLEGLGEGNIITPEVEALEHEYLGLRWPYDANINKKYEEAYLDILKKVLSIGSTMEETLQKLSHYQATSIRLSRVLEARNTSAEYLRQWNTAIAKKESKRTERASATGTFEAPVKISASLLSVPAPSQFAQRSIEAIRAGADFIHYDVAEGKRGKTAVLEDESIDTTEAHTPERLKEIKTQGRAEGLYIPIDVHLLIMDPSEDYIKSFIDAGADVIWIHWEAFADKGELVKRLKFIKGHGVRAGIALRPDADIEKAGKFITVEARGYIDMISQAGVYPFYEGQVFVYDVLKNIRALREDFRFDGTIAIDGGVESEISSKKAIEAGADFIVAGSAFFGDGRRDVGTLEIAAKSLRDSSPIPYGSIYDIIAERILELRKQKKGKLWIRLSGYHSSGKSVTRTKIIESLKTKDAGLNIVDFPQDDFWSDRQERKRRREDRDPTYKNGLTHLRMAELNKAVRELSEAVGDVTFNNIYDFDSGGINGTKTHHLAEDSIIIAEGCYLEAAESEDFDLSIFIRTDLKQAKERAMARDRIRVHREPKDTQDLYEDVYEPTFARYLKAYKPEERSDIVIDTTTIDNPAIANAKQPIKLLECTLCQKQFTVGTRISRCPFCGGDLEFDIKGKVDFESSIIQDDKSMWRYRKILPVDEDFIVSAGEGNTPVVYLEDLSKKLGIELYAKLDSENPTGTFKDREASFVISRSRQLGQDDVVMQSTGNTGVAITYYAGLAGMRSYFFGPLLSRYKLLMPDKKQDAKIILVDGEPADVKAAATDFALAHNFPKISPFYERCEANTTQAYEIAEKILKGELPNLDFYVQPIAAGMGPIGFFTGIDRVSRWTAGKIGVPRIVAVQISEFAPVQEAWEMDLEQVGPKGLTPKFASAHPFEPTLHTTNAPAYYPFLRRLLKGSDGILTKVEPDYVKTFMQEFRDSLRRHGIELSDTENSSYVGYAGLVQQVEGGAIPKGSNVILMVTGKGAKKYIEAQPDAIIPTGYDPEKLLEQLGVAKPTSRASSSGEAITRRLMNRIHNLNIELTVPLEKGKRLWHVLPISLVPQDPHYNQRTKFIEFINNMNRLYPTAKEKIRVVTERQDLSMVVRDLASDPNNIVDCALDSEGSIEKLPDGVRMLVFEPEDGAVGNFRQLEGILASLRALHIEDYEQKIERLTMLHRLLTGEAPKHLPDPTDSYKEFARKFKFILPPITVENYEGLRRLNENLLRLIESA